jgi:SAM-dependent methyltransferase
MRAMSRFDWRETACPICSATATRFLGWRGGRAHRNGTGELTRVVECASCGLVYPNPFPHPRDVDQLYSDEGDTYFSQHTLGEERVAMRSKLVERIEELASGRKGRLLDVGAGTGETVLAALRRGWDAHGVEPCESFARAAIDLCGADRIRHGGIETLGEVAPFDAIMLAGVLEHLHEPVPVMQRIAELLVPGGILYVDVPNEGDGIYFRAANLYFKLLGRDWTSHLAPTFSPFHVLGFSRRSLGVLLRRFGLSEASLTYYTGFKPLPFRPSPRGVLEFVGSRMVKAAASQGRFGTFLECYARRDASGDDRPEAHSPSP